MCITIQGTSNDVNQFLNEIRMRYNDVIGLTIIQLLIFHPSLCKSPCSVCVPAFHIFYWLYSDVIILKSVSGGGGGGME
jgi:hypothetical protein